MRVLEHSVKRICYTVAAVYLETVLIFYKQLILLLGHPILGDDVYGKAFPGIEGQCLHAAKIGFIHPSTGEYMEFQAPLPDYFEDLLKKLRQSSAG